MGRNARHRWQSPEERYLAELKTIEAAKNGKAKIVGEMHESGEATPEQIAEYGKLNRQQKKAHVDALRIAVESMKTPEQRSKREERRAERKRIQDEAAEEQKRKVQERRDRNKALQEARKLQKSRSKGKG